MEVLSLDFVYTPARDVDEAVAYYMETVGARLRWMVRAMGTVVACIEVVETAPAVLLAEHLDGATPVLVYRVADYAQAVRELRERDATGIRELGIPQGPLAVFDTPAGERIGVYELTRPAAGERFEGRIDTPVA